MSRIGKKPVALPQGVTATVDGQTSECFRVAAWPMHADFLDLRGVAQPKVQPFAQLRQKRISGAKRLDQRASRLLCENNLDSRADRIAVTRSTFEPHGQKRMVGGQIVPQQPHLRAGPVGDPEVQVAVMVPVDAGNPASITSVTLGDGTPTSVGAPSLDLLNAVIYVGTDQGIIYAVDFPLP